MQKLSHVMALTLLLVPASLLCSEPEEVYKQLTQVAASAIRSKQELGNISLYYNENNDFIVDDNDEIRAIQPCFVSNSLKKMNPEQLGKFLNAGRIIVKKMNDGEFALDAKVLGDGGGPIFGEILAWTTKVLCYSTILTAAGAAVVTTAGPVVAAATGAAASGAGIVVGGAATAAGVGAPVAVVSATVGAVAASGTATAGITTGAIAGTALIVEASTAVAAATTATGVAATGGVLLGGAVGTGVATGVASGSIAATVAAGGTATTAVTAPGVVASTVAGIETLSMAARIAGNAAWFLP